MTDSMRAAISETSRRRAIQEAYNVEHGITPQSIVKAIDAVMSSVYERDYLTPPVALDGTERFRTQADLDAYLAARQDDMRQAAANLDFEKAAALRDEIKRLRNPELAVVRAERRRVTVMTFIEARLKHAALEVQEYVRLLVATVRAIVTPPRYSHDIVEQLDLIGVGSLTVVLLTGFFTGAALASQAGLTLDQYGGRAVVGKLISTSMIKELGPVLTALMLTGRIGSGIAAELGSMVVTDQIFALRALGTDPVRKLVVPRVLAGVLMAPVLTIISDFVGIRGRLARVAVSAPGGLGRSIGRR